MPKPSHREKILTEGLHVLHERGFMGASVRDISLAAGVPLGSFTNHFTSKEAFGLEVLNLYFERIREVIRETLLNDSLPPLQRLRAYVDVTAASVDQDDTWNGCLLGNFSADASEHSELIRLRLVEIYKELEQAVAYCLHAAVNAGELPPSTESNALAGFIISSYQGALLQSKAERSLIPIERYKQFVFGTLLR